VWTKWETITALYNTVTNFSLFTENSRYGTCWNCTWYFYALIDTCSTVLDPGMLRLNAFCLSKKRNSPGEFPGLIVFLVVFLRKWIKIPLIGPKQKHKTNVKHFCSVSFIWTKVMLECTDFFNFEFNLDFLTLTFYLDFLTRIFNFDF